MFDVAVTDTDGSTDTDQVEVRIVDDVPTANPDGTYSVAEQAALTFDALANDVKGADGINLVDRSSCCNWSYEGQRGL